MASRVKLRRTDNSDSSETRNNDWSRSERVSELCARDPLLRDALHAAQNEGCTWAARCARLRAERRVLQCALARAADTAHRLYCACAVQESTSVSLCCALRAADRALETYDVLLALAETQHDQHDQRAAAELVASQLLSRLESEQSGAVVGALLSPGPWLAQAAATPAPRWSRAAELRLRAHAARLKADTVALRDTQTQPKLFSYHDVEESELGAGCSAAEMEAAVALHSALAAPHALNKHCTHKSGSSRRSRRARPRHWLDTQASETDL